MTSLCYREGMKHSVVSVTEFKAKCLSMLDGIGARGGTITITKRGRPLATVSPAHQLAWKSPEGQWIGRVTLADGVLDADISDLWDVVRPQHGARG
jgi:antitoxin (DNA-binding transcriptional repressor) of toxin-antitoxin stability system